MDRLIARERSIIPACDVPFDRFEHLVKETHQIAEVGAYKISAELALSVGLKKVVDTARKYTRKPLIYDHQKAATDIPETAHGFVTAVKQCGIDALILFPLAGPVTEEAWINAAQKVGLPVIVGGHMTHECFLVKDGGFIANEAVEQIFTIAARKGVSNFVVPGNKPDVIQVIRRQVAGLIGQPVFYAPGFIKQGGEITEAAKAAGSSWHAIVGRAIYDATDIQEETRQIAAAI